MSPLRGRGILLRPAIGRALGQALGRVRGGTMKRGRAGTINRSPLEATARPTARPSIRAVAKPLAIPIAIPKPLASIIGPRSGPASGRAPAITPTPTRYLPNLSLANTFAIPRGAPTRAIAKAGKRTTTLGASKPSIRGAIATQHSALLDSGPQDLSTAQHGGRPVRQGRDR